MTIFHAIFSSRTCFISKKWHAFFIVQLTILLYQNAIANPINGQTVKKAIAEVIAQKDMRYASVGISIVNVKSTETIAEYNPHQALVPASTLKLITTATALSLLGKDFKFETKIEYDGTLSDGVLNGNLYIRGGGDPTLGAENYQSLIEEWATLVQTKGIKKIIGYIIGDERIFDMHTLPNTWIWEDIGNYYGAACSGLNFHANQYKLYLKPSGLAGGNVTVLRTEPDIKELQFFNEMKTGAPKSGDNGYIFGAPYSYERSLRGTIPAGVPTFAIRGSLPDPAFMAAKQLEITLRKKGIIIQKGSITYRIAKTENKPITETAPTTLHTHYSDILENIVGKTNLESINLNAEAMLRMIGKQQKGKGSTKAGIEAMLDFWHAKDIPTESMMIEDGSGLSRFNAIPAKTLTSILVQIAKEPIYQSFLKSLPVAGLNGTLRNFGVGTLLDGKMTAKTGYMKRARCLVGYIKTKSDKEIAFAVMLNNYQVDVTTANKYIEKILLAVANL